MPKIREVTFKSISPFYEWEKSGDKPFTFRKIDMGDRRFYDLGKFTATSRLTIKIINPANGESFERKVTGVEYLKRCPNWMVIYWEHKEDL